MQEMQMAFPNFDEEFPHSLTINIPFPTHRLANVALRSLSVDEELSPLVNRDFALIATSADATSTGETPVLHSPSVANNSTTAMYSLAEDQNDLTGSTSKLNISQSDRTILRVYYKAATPRMLRVAVNGFFESLGEIVQIMEELDVEVLHAKGMEDLGGVQGVEQGLTGTAVGAGG